MAARKASSAEEGSGGFAVQQKIAAETVEKREAETHLASMSKAQSLIDASKRRLDADCLRLKLRQQPGTVRRFRHIAALDQCRQRLLNRSCSGFRVMQTTMRPA